MTAAARRPRAGFTLLEVLLASAIAVLLLGALYVAFDLTLRQTDAGRDAVAQGDLGRAIVNRMTIDLSGCLGQLQPNSGGASSGASGGTGSSAAAGSASSTTPSAGTAAAATPTTTTTGSSSSTSMSSTGSLTPDTPAQAGVYGSSQQLTLYISRVPPGQMTTETIAAGTDQQPADQLRVTYYLSSGGRGLCRQVRPWVTADGVRNATDPDPGTEDADLLAEEVQDVQFEYFDGASWQTEWDGSQTQSDGATLVGPPRAIRMTLTLQPPAGGTAKQIQHVFALRASVGVPYQPGVAGSGTTTTTTGTNTTSSSAGGM